MSACGVEGETYQPPASTDLVAASCLTNPYKVKWVTDGDTINLDIPGVNDSDGKTTVRLKGINTPEVSHAPNFAPAEPCGEAAELYTKTTIGTEVELEFNSDCAADPFNDNDCRDNFGRLLAYVKLADCSDLGLRLLQNGLAQVYDDFPFDRQSHYTDAKNTAQSQGVGIFGGACSQ